MDDKHSRTPERVSVTRLLWVVGLVAGIAIGAAAAFGIAGSQDAPAVDAAE